MQRHQSRTHMQCSGKRTVTMAGIKYRRGRGYHTEPETAWQHYRNFSPYSANVFPTHILHKNSLLHSEKHLQQSVKTL